MAFLIKDLKEKGFFWDFFPWCASFERESERESERETSPSRITIHEKSVGPLVRWLVRPRSSDDRLTLGEMALATRI